MHLVASAAPGPGGLPLVVTIFGSPDTTAETLTEYEIGYRLERRSYSVDLTGFVGRFTDLATTVRGTPGIAQEMGTRVFRIPLTASSSGLANTEGVEIAGTWKPARWWQVSSNYSYSDVKPRTRSNDGTTALSTAVNGPVPHHQVHVRTFMDLSRKFEASALFYQSSKVPKIGIDGFKRLDLQMTWSSARNVELVGGVRSLLHGATIEYVDSTARAVPTVVRPNPYGEIRWSF
jgi:outer membrane receptor for ferrienterochelin and colicin